VRKNKFAKSAVVCVCEYCPELVSLRKIIISWWGELWSLCAIYSCSLPCFRLSHWREHFFFRAVVRNEVSSIVRISE